MSSEDEARTRLGEACTAGFTWMVWAKPGVAAAGMVPDGSVNRVSPCPANPAASDWAN